MLARRGGRDYRSYEAIPLSAFAGKIKAAKHNRIKQLRRTGASFVATHCSLFFYTGRVSIRGPLISSRHVRPYIRPARSARASASSKSAQGSATTSVDAASANVSTNRIPWPDAALRQIAGSSQAAARRYSNPAQLRRVQQHRAVEIGGSASLASPMGYID
jgi:hypothetical protein